MPRKPQVNQEDDQKKSSWQNEQVFIAEMDRRFKEMGNNKVKTISLEELEKGARERYKRNSVK